ncbi:MAG: Holliday junction branch migration protein RuvA [bacterium]
MIGRLRGRIINKQPPSLLIDVNGIGYEVEAPMSTFYALPHNDEPVVLHTHLLVREDAQILYGFASEADRSLFRTLLKVSGVGGKMALAILSGMTAEEFSQAIQAGDTAQLTRLPGVGKKTAERLIVEMRDRLEKLDLPDAGTSPSVSSGPRSADGDAVSALIALGYKPNEASKMVRAVASADMDTESLIKAALQAKG